MVVVVLLFCEAGIVAAVLTFTGLAVDRGVFHLFSLRKLVAHLKSRIGADTTNRDVRILEFADMAFDSPAAVMFVYHTVGRVDLISFSSRHRHRTHTYPNVPILRTSESGEPHFGHLIPREGLTY